MTPMFRACVCLMAISLAPAAPSGAAPDPITIRMATIAPKGSPWYRLLESIKADWAAISGGRVNLVLTASAGDERALIRKMQVGQFQAVAVSGVGLPELGRGISALHMPLVFETYEELDHVRNLIGPKLEDELASQGVVVLHWSDVGWIYFFSTERVRTPADLRALTVYTTAGDASTEALMKGLGMRPRPLPTTELLTQLHAGNVQAFDVPPLFAMLNQSAGLAKYLLDLKFAVLTGATLVDRRSWETIPVELRQPLKAAAARAAAAHQDGIRTLGDDAIVELERQGLKVERLDPATRALWQREAEAAWPKFRDTVAPADIIDDVLRLVAEYRRRPAK